MHALSAAPTRAPLIRRYASLPFLPRATCIKLMMANPKPWGLISDASELPTSHICAGEHCKAAPFAFAKAGGQSCARYSKLRCRCSCCPSALLMLRSHTEMGCLAVPTALPCHLWCRLGRKQPRQLPG